MPVASSNAFIDSANLTPSGSLPSKAPSTVTVVPVKSPKTACSNAPPGIMAKDVSGIGICSAIGASSSVPVSSEPASVGASVAAGSLSVSSPSSLPPQATKTSVKTSIRLNKNHKFFLDIVFLFLLRIENLFYFECFYG